MFDQCMKPKFIPSIAGNEPVHTKSIVFLISNACFAKKSFTNWNTSFVLVAVFSSSQKRKFFLIISWWTYLANAIPSLTAIRNIGSLVQLEGDFQGTSLRLWDNLFQITKLKSAIWLGITLFDSGTNSSFFLASFPSIFAAISKTHELFCNRMSFLRFRYFKHHLVWRHQQWFDNRHKTSW